MVIVLILRVCGFHHDNNIHGWRDSDGKLHRRI